MSTSNLAAYPESTANYSYTENVCRAALALIAAVLALTPFQPNTKAAHPIPADYANVEARNELYRLAKEVEPIMPNQAAELRYFAR